MKPMDMDLQFVADALPAFLSEAQEQITGIEQLLLQLEDAPGDRALLDALFRCAHTVKGSAGIFGLGAVVDFTHHVETLLDQLRAGALQLTPGLGTLLLRCNDQIRLLVAAARDPGCDDDAARAARAALVLQLQAAAGTDGGAPDSTGAEPAGAATAAPTAGWQVDARFGPETYRNGMDPLTILRYVAGLGTLSQVQCDTAAVPDLEAVDPETCHLGLHFQLHTDADAAAITGAFSFVQDDCVLQLQPPATAADHAPAAEAARPAASAPAPAGAPAAATAPRGGSGTSPALAGDDGRFIRVQADRLDAVIDLLGELVIAGAGAQLLARQARHRGLVEANTQMGRLIEEIRNGTLKLRMVPIGETFSRFRRVVRDTAADLGKEVALEISGADTELDKAVVERIADPLMHLVRNGLDHGLETPAERSAAGKPAQGRLMLSACHEAGGILIRIADDGRGIQRGKVLERAWARGLLPPGHTPPDADILQLIFEPGFSTAETVTNLSGRGVGMDVVRRNIEALRGTVTVHSTEGAGSSIEIRLPLTLAIIDGFLVGVGSTKFIVPLEAVGEVIAARDAAVQTDGRGRACVELRGRVLPVVDLRRLYALDGQAPARASVVVLRGAQGRSFGIVVDALLGQHQTVIKPLARMFQCLRGISGSSILGSGEVALIVDVPALAQLAAQPAARPAPQPAATPPAALSTLP